jgi:hypothetical protein
MVYGTYNELVFLGFTNSRNITEGCTLVFQQPNHDRVYQSQEMVKHPLQKIFQDLLQWEFQEPKFQKIC